MIKYPKTRGSILIWTLLLGISLASVFFFFSQRLTLNAASQQETMEYLNAASFIESFADYIEQLPVVTLVGLRDANDGILKTGFHGISGSLSNVAVEVAGILDVGESATYTATIPIPASDSIKIEWDKCPADSETLEISAGSITPIANNGCTAPCLPGQVCFNNSATTTDNSFALSAPVAPTHYRLTPQGTAVLYDNLWHLTLELPLAFRKTIRISRTFVSQP